MAVKVKKPVAPAVQTGVRQAGRWVPSTALRPARSEPELYRGDLQMFSAMIFAACVMATVMVPAELAQAQVSVDIGIHLGSPP
jgi:hypothetical protein